MLPWRLIFAKALNSPKQGFTARFAGKTRAACNFHSSPGSEYHDSSAGSTPLSERGPFVSRLKSRGVLRFDGPDAVKYLQGLVTNDLRRLEETPSDAGVSLPTPNQPVVFSGPIYTAFLTPQGRFLYDLFVYRPIRAEEKLDRTGSGPGGDTHQPALLADVDIHFLDELLDHLKKYRLRAKVEIQDVSKDMAAWQRFGRSLVDDSDVDKDAGAKSIGWGGGADFAGRAAAQSNGQGWRWFRDPRLASMGLRGLFPSDTVPPLVEADKEVDEQYYLLWRLEEGVPEGSTEIPKGEAIPLEYNLAGLNAISFEKGCYVGQESVARTHHRGVIRKRLLPVNFIRDSGEEVHQAVAPKSEIIEVNSGKKVGTVTTALGSRGLALLRLEAAFKNTSQLNVKGLENVNVKVIRPKWWPSEWGQEEEQATAVA